MKSETLRHRITHFLRTQVRPFVIMAVVLFAARSSLADWNDVPTGSMNPTIMEGDRIFVNKLAYDLKIPFTTKHLATWADPQRGDVVVFYAPTDGTRMVKRVMAVPGDTIEMRENQLIVNGQPAGYSPIDSAWLATLSPEQTNGRVYATETVAGRSHPTAFIPSLASRRSFAPVNVPEGKYLMLGDNRDNSADSRFWGLVDRSQIVGRATGVAASFDPQKTLSPKFGRFFQGME